MDKDIITKRWPNIKFTSIPTGGELSSVVFTRSNVKMAMGQTIPLLTEAAYAYANGDCEGLPLQVGSILSSMDYQAKLSEEEHMFYCSYCDKAYGAEDFGGHIGAVRFCRVCLSTSKDLDEAYSKTLGK